MNQLANAFMEKKKGGCVKMEQNLLILPSLKR